MKKQELINKSDTENKGQMLQGRSIQRGSELGGVNEYMKSVFSKIGAENSAEGFISILASPEFSHLVNASQKENMISHLQQTHGNRYIRRVIQAKLKIGQPNDKYEQEADRVADEVMRMPVPRTHEKPIASTQIQPTRFQRPYLKCKEEVRRRPIKGEEEKESEEEDKKATFKWCNEEKRKLIQKGIKIIEEEDLPGIAIKALTKLLPKFRERRAIESNFGPISDKQKKTIISRYKHIETTINNKNIICLANCKTEKGSDPCAKAKCPGNMIYVCPGFGAGGCSDVGKIMLHEAAHNADACGDIDRDGDYPPANAEDNAYSYQYFVEDLQKEPEEHELPSRPEKEVEIQVPEGPVWRVQRWCCEYQEELKGRSVQEKETEIPRGKGMPDNVPGIVPDLEAGVRSLRGGGQPLPESVRAFFEPRFGYDFGQVRVHTDARASGLAKALNARAFTVGQNIFFGQGAYKPGSLSERKLLAHELTHVVQQAGGQVKPILTASQATDKQELAANKIASRMSAGDPANGSIIMAQGRGYTPWISGRQLQKRKLTHLVQMQVSGPLRTETVPPTEFIQSNEEFFRDLIMAINEFGKKGRMDGQVPFYTRAREEFEVFGNWTAIEKRSLKRELLSWRQNADSIAVSNYESCLFAFIDAIAEKIFKPVPGLSSLTLDLIEGVKFMIAAGISLLTGPGCGLILGLIVGFVDLLSDIAVNHINEAMAEEELKKRLEKFSRSIRDSKVFRGTLLSNLYNLETLSLYYQSWLDQAEPEELAKFRIPSSPEKVSQEEVKKAMILAFPGPKKAEVAKRKGRKITRVELFYFLQNIGMLINNANINLSLAGDCGRAQIRNSETLPVWRFEPYLKLEFQPQTRELVYVYVSPQARRMIAGLSIPEKAHWIVLLHARTGSQAAYDYLNARWITGMTRKEWFEETY